MALSRIDLTLVYSAALPYVKHVDYSARGLLAHAPLTPTIEVHDCVCQGGF